MRHENEITYPLSRRQLSRKKEVSEKGFEKNYSFYYNR